MKIFGWQITKASSNTGGRNIPLETTSTPWERSSGAIAHDDYSGLIAQYKNWVYVGVFKNAVCVAKYPLKLYARKSKKVKKIISKHKDVDESFYKFLNNSAHLRKFTIDSDAVVEITDHPVLDLLNTVNPQMNRFDLFSKTEMFLDLTGNVYWYLVLNQFGLPEQLWPLSPVHMKVNVADSSKMGDFITGYTFTNGTQKIQFKKEEIIHFTFPSPFSNIYGLGTVAAGQDSIKFDHSSRQYENVLLDNQCRPDVILETEQKLSQPDHDSLIGRIRNAYAGRRGLGKWMVLDKGLSAKPLNLPPREMGFLQGRKASKEEIAGILGIPVSKLTTEDVNLANAYVGSVQYITDTIVPRLTMMEEKLNERLMPMYDENLFLTYGDIIPSDKNYRLEELQTHLTTKYSSINEERKKDGLDPVDWGDKPVEETAPQPQEPLEENPLEGGKKKPALRLAKSLVKPSKGKKPIEQPMPKKKDWIDQAAEDDALADEVMQRVLARLQ